MEPGSRTRSRPRLQTAIEGFMSVPSAPTAAASESRNDLRRGANHWTVIHGLLPFVWPQDRRDLRIRVVIAFSVLLLAKLAEVSLSAGAGTRAPEATKLRRAAAAPQTMKEAA